MRITIVAAALVTAALLPAHSRADSSQLYRCPDGMFTNRAELLCEPYETTGRVVIMPGDSNLAAVRPLLGEPAPREQAHPLPAPSGVCQLYNESVGLNLATYGGRVSQTTEDRQRWLALSRIFTAIGKPHCL